MECYELYELEHQIENAIETFRKNGKKPPYKFECNEQLYKILEQSPYVDKVGKGLHYYSKKDGSVVYAPKPETSHISPAFGDSFIAKLIGKWFDDIFKEEAMRDFDPVYLRWEEPDAKQIKIKKIEVPELTPYERVIQAKKNREVYIPEKLKRKRWNEPYNKK